MPLFMCLAGMVFSLKFKDFPQEVYTFTDALREIRKSAHGLVLPFVAWTVLHAVILYSKGGNVAKYFVNVIKSPDWSLWFLLVLFWCRTAFSLIYALYCLLTGFAPKLKGIFFFVVLLLMFYALTKLLRRELLGLGLFKWHFRFFALGVFLFRYRRFLASFLDNAPAKITAIILFAASVPFWYFITPNPTTEYLSQLFAARLWLTLFKHGMPLLGIYIFMFAVQALIRTKCSYIVDFLDFTGKMTLGIYALHQNYLWMLPPFLAPLSLSMAITFLIDRIPIVRTLFLGK